MIRQKAISYRLLLTAIFAGLNLLCFMGIMHGRHVVQHTRVNYSHIPANGPRRAGERSGRESVVAAIDAVIDHAVVDHLSKAALSMSVAAGPAAGAQVAVATASLVLPAPEDRTEPLAQENVLALGSAPRAPGLGRGPPLS
ncbi:hypothetical protein [Edaphobacter aggregans]|uniref:hypothetical protein n=1 Tax=Edaphobacter aggregans TaxID=570835 RepID=UPI00054F2E93|nr:hypothetical protein [Edaphobacter aggregans]